MRSIMILVAVFSGPAWGQSRWPQFRGPGAAGVGEGELPEIWSDTVNVVWKVPVPGRGWSSPIVWDGKVLLTSAVSEGDEEVPKKGLYLGGDRKKPPAHPHRFSVFCLDAETGRVLWERVAHRGPPEGSRHLKNTYA